MFDLGQILTTERFYFWSFFIIELLVLRHYREVFQKLESMLKVKRAKEKFWSQCLGILQHFSIDLIRHKENGTCCLL